MRYCRSPLSGRLAVVCFVCLSSVHQALTFTFSTSSKPMNRFWLNLTGNKSLMSDTKFGFSFRLCHLRWQPWPQFAEIFFNFFSVIAEWILKIMAGSKSSTSTTKLVFMCWSAIRDGRHGFWLYETLNEFFSATAEWILTKLDLRQVLHVLYCFFVPIR